MKNKCYKFLIKYIISPIDFYGICTENHLHTCWRDPSWVSMLNPSNIMDYFSQSPFYDRTCNNEVIKMQRLKPNQLQNMTGIEYILIHVQENILYIIRKFHRYSPTQSK